MSTSSTRLWRSCVILFLETWLYLLFVLLNSLLYPLCAKTDVGTKSSATHSAIYCLWFIFSTVMFLDFSPRTNTLMDFSLFIAEWELSFPCGWLMSIFGCLHQKSYFTFVLPFPINNTRWQNLHLNFSYGLSFLLFTSRFSTLMQLYLPVWEARLCGRNWMNVRR